MILHGSTIASTHHARQMAAHLYKVENEHVIPRETIGQSKSRTAFENDLVQMHLFTRMTKGKRGIFHVAINPRDFESLTSEQKDRAIEIIEEKFGLTGQTRMQVEHIKEGRAHSHVFWSTVDQDQGKLIDLPHYKRRLQDCADQMEKEFGHERTCRETNEHSFEITNAERMAERKTGRKAMANKEQVTTIWNQTESWENFLNGLRKNGYEVAKGERCRFALIDPKGNVSNLVRQLPRTVKTKDVRVRAGELEQQLPDLEKAKKLHDKRNQYDRENSNRQQKERASQHKREKRYRDLNVEEATKRGLRHFLERQSAVSEKRLVYHITSNSSFKKEEVEETLKKQKKVITAQKDNVQYVTTTEALQEEEKIISYARKGIGTQRALNANYVPKQEFLNDGQKGAISHALNSNDQVIIVSGGAGVGKTSLMKEVKQGIEEQGKTLHAFAPSANASRGVLRDKGFEGANTIAALLKSKKLQDQTRNGVILIDEAGMVGNKTMNQVFKVAEQNNARVILSGDWRQHNSPEAGDALRIIEQKAGLKVARVNEIVRQKNKEYKRAVDQLSQGKTNKGFDQLDKMGTITEVIDHQERYERAANDYIDSLRQGRTALVVSPTHLEGRAVSATIRNKLKEKGYVDEQEKAFTTQNSLSLTLDEKQNATTYQEGMSIQCHSDVPGFERGKFYDISGHRDDGAVIVRNEDGKCRALPLYQADRFQVFQKEQTQIAKGDPLRITGNGQSLEGSQMNNGEIHTVAGFDKAGNIQLDNGKTVPKNYRNFALGYYSTSHASQGKDAQDVYIVQSSRSFIASSDKQFYVSVSRGEERIKIYTDDKEGLKEAVSRSGDRMTAEEVAERSPSFVFNKESRKQATSEKKNEVHVLKHDEHSPKEQAVNDNEKSELAERFTAKAEQKESAEAHKARIKARILKKRERSKGRGLDL